MNRRHLLAALFAGMLVPTVAPAQDVAFARALAEPGVHAIMRHALAPGGGDPAGFRLDDCTTQRNLDDRGRAQARRIGATLRQAGADFDAVLTSRWCRCAETADLLDLGEVVPFPALDSFFADRSTAGAQTRALRNHLTGLPEGGKVMLVTHQVNLTALLDVFPASGEVFLFRIAPGGGIEIVGNMEIDP